MIYKHRKTGKLYRFMLPAFDVTRQSESAIYICLESGAIFTRDGKEFAEKFEFVDYTQYKIKPKEKKT